MVRIQQNQIRNSLTHSHIQLGIEVYANLYGHTTHLQRPIGSFMVRFRISLRALRFNAIADTVTIWFCFGVFLGSSVWSEAGHSSSWVSAIQATGGGYALAITLIMPHTS